MTDEGGADSVADIRMADEGGADSVADSHMTDGGDANDNHCADLDTESMRAGTRG